MLFCLLLLSLLQEEVEKVSASGEKRERGARGTTVASDLPFLLDISMMTLLIFPST